MLSLAAADARDPVDAARAFLASLNRSGPLVVAVSGGGDSVALLGACREVLAAGGLAPRRLIAATVDHGLRPGSAGEARQVRGLCADLGIEHHILSWTGEKPRSGVQAAARLARYRLLGDLAGRLGAVGVATAHTRDDQAETVAMRAGRHGGEEAARGLAGMAPATLFDRSCWILRPFLGTGREQLRRWLSARGTGWIDDPSNEDERFERVRVRRQRGAGAATPGVAERQEARRLASDAVAALLTERGRTDGGFLLSLDLAGGDRADRALRDAAALMMSVAGGRPHLPGRETARRLAAFLAAGTPSRFTASRAVAELRGGRLYVYRERRNLPLLRVAAGERRLYDSRYRIAVTGGQTVEISPPERDEAAEVGNHPELSGIPTGVARRAFAAEPVFRCDGDGFSVWQAKPPGVEVVRHFAPFDVFLPLFDYMLANRCAALFGQDAYPPPPVGAPAA